MSNYDSNQAAYRKRQLMRGATAEQKLAINYFLPSGCFFMGIKDEDYDAAVARAAQATNSYRRAIDKIGIDESELQEIPPVTLFGYDDDAEFKKLTKTGQFRSSKYSITHIFFSSTEVYMYQVTFSMVDNERKERTEEYFYKDITNFSTNTETVEVSVIAGCSSVPRTRPVQIQEFALIVPGDRFTCSTLGDIEQQVKAMKNKLREKKL